MRLATPGECRSLNWSVRGKLFLQVIEFYDHIQTHICSIWSALNNMQEYKNILSPFVISIDVVEWLCVMGMRAWRVFLCTSWVPWDSILQVLLPMQRQICRHDTLLNAFQTPSFSGVLCVTFSGRKGKSYLCWTVNLSKMNVAKVTAPPLDWRVWLLLHEHTHTHTHTGEHTNTHSLSKCGCFKVSLPEGRW